jgi:hypothetical protein
LRVGDVPALEKLSFEGHRRMVGMRHGKARCRGGKVCVSAPAVKQPEMKRKMEIY